MSEGKRLPRTPTDAMTAPDLEPDLDRWIRLFRGPLVGFLASRCRSWADAEELAMDSFAEAWLGRARIRARVDDLVAVGAYLRGIALNLALARQRQVQRGPRPLGDDVPATPIVPNDDRMDSLRSAFPELRPELQEVLRMHYLEATSAREVAALLGTTEKAIENRLYQARRALRALAERHLRTAQAATR
jgi:RNA polymerase sigma-70 factor (ECF subfamily)